MSPLDVKGMAMPGHLLVELSDSDLKSTMRQLHDELGCSWVRFDFYWDGLEPQQGIYDWSVSDRLVKASVAANLRILGLLHTMPAWLRPAGTTLVHGPTSSHQVERWGLFCSAAAQRYAGRVSAWELWNEPNLIAFWSPKPDPSAYARALFEGFQAIAEADPSAIVVSGGPGGPTRPGELNPLEFIEKVLDAGAVGHMHAVGLHPYTNLTGAADGALSQAVAVAEALKTRGMGGTPLWGTETGAPTLGTDGAVITEAEQAALVGTTFDYWSHSVPDAGPLFWYTLLDTGRRSRYETYGIVRADGQKKPAFEALKDVTGT